MSAPTNENENGLALAAVDFGGKHKQESEWSPQSPQQDQTPTQRQRRASWRGRGGVWLVACARTLTTENTRKHNYYYYFYYVLIHSVVGSGFCFLFCCFSIFF